MSQTCFLVCYYRLLYASRNIYSILFSVYSILFIRRAVALKCGSRFKTKKKLRYKRVYIKPSVGNLNTVLKGHYSKKATITELKIKLLLL